MLYDPIPAELVVTDGLTFVCRILQYKRAASCSGPVGAKQAEIIFSPPQEVFVVIHCMMVDNEPHISTFFFYSPLGENRFSLCYTHMITIH